MTHEQKTTMILGGNGKTGRRVADRLRARGLPVRIGSRTGTPPFSWADEGTWAPALEGVGSLYITYQPDLFAPSAPGHIRGVTELAVKKGVRRIVLLSGRGEPHVWPSERAVRDSGVEHTVVRCSWFNQNFNEGHMLEPILSGELAFPAGDVREPFVDLDDVADVVVAALTDAKHAGKTYELTGPRLLSFAEAVAEIAKAAGRDVRYVPVKSEEYAAGLAQIMPADEAAVLTELFAYILDGHNAYVDDDVERVLGRPARDFSQYAREAAAAGAWGR